MRRSALTINNKNENIMKSNVMPSIVQIEENHLQELVQEVKETIATGYMPVAKRRNKSFGIADLWNIQRGMKLATPGRR
jgi:hypothetical protein